MEQVRTDPSARSLAGALLSGGPASGSGAELASRTVTGAAGAGRPERSPRDGSGVGADIELVSDKEAPLLRWRFSQITADSFVRTSEIRPDRGTDWSPRQEVRASRVDRRG